MPKVTIWIRNEDYDKWLAIENKPEWLHDRINGKWDKGDTSARDNLMSKSSVFDEPKLTPPEDSV